VERSPLGLPAMRSVAVAVVLKRFGDPRAQLRRSALVGLSRLAQRGDARVVSRLLRCVQSPDTGVCCDALAALPQYAHGNDSEALAAMVECLWHKRKRVRGAGAVAICEIATRATEMAPEMIIVFVAQNLRSHTCDVYQNSALQVLVQIVEAGGTNAMAAVMEHLGPGYVRTISRIRAETHDAKFPPSNHEDSDSELSDVSWGECS